MTNAIKKRLLNLMSSKNRLLSTEEVFDFYIDNIMRNDVTCKLNNYRKGRHYDDYTLWELEQKAAQWYRTTVGSMVLNKTLHIKQFTYEEV